MAEDIVLLPFFDIMILVVINVENKLPDRKSTQLKNYDYSNTGVYFVTICIEGRKQILSEIIKSNNTSVSKMQNQNLVGEGLAPPENEKVDLSSPPVGYASFANNYKTRLTEIGEIAQEQLFALEERFKNVRIKNYVIMPDHIHVLIYLRKAEGGASPSPTTTFLFIHKKPPRGVAF